MSDFHKFQKIRDTYAKLLPYWMEEYKQTGEMRQDPYFMDWEFTPIERPVWSDIRSVGIPFFPQLPVLNYFLDFGCPFLKIGIECDGKAWHSHDIDKGRDARLAAEGWMIFRIEGHKCLRILTPEEQAEFEEDDDYAAKTEKFYMSTSEGIITAIRRKYFDDPPSTADDYLIESTLFEHRSTPETFPVRIPYSRRNGPILIGDALEDYISTILHRMKEGAA